MAGSKRVTPSSKEFTVSRLRGDFMVQTKVTHSLVIHKCLQLIQ